MATPEAGAGAGLLDGEPVAGRERAPVEPAEADDLAGPRFEVDAVQPVLPRQATHLDRRCGGLRRSLRHRLGREGVFDVAADHHLDDLGIALRAGREGGHVPAVAEHRAVIGQLGNLIHAVRDVDDGDAARLRQVLLLLPLVAVLAACGKSEAPAAPGGRA